MCRLPPKVILIKYFSGLFFWPRVPSCGPLYNYCLCLSRFWTFFPFRSNFFLSLYMDFSLFLNDVIFKCKKASARTSSDWFCFRILLQSLSPWLSQITQNQHPHIQNPPTIYSQRIPNEFQKNSQRIPKEIHKNSLRIHKEFPKNSQRILIKFSKNTKKIPNQNPQSIPKEFPKTS